MDAECSDDVMKLSVKFNDTFNGLIYSAGERDDESLKLIYNNSEQLWSPRPDSQSRQ